MTDGNLAELENPPDIITACYPRFAEALARAVAELRRRSDDHAKLREELATTRAQLLSIFDAAQADSLDGVLAKLNGKDVLTEGETDGMCGLCHEKPKAPGDWVCPGCREHLDGLSPRTKRANRPGGGSNHGWLAGRRANGGY